MILFFIVALLILPLDCSFFNSLPVHLSDSLKLKCDSLPYRTAYTGTRCYFAVLKDERLEETTSKCSLIFPGAKVETSVPSSIFNSMMVERSKFHVGKDSSGNTFKSSGAKQFICMFDSKYTCEKGETSTIFPGKCISQIGQNSKYSDAERYCTRLGMELPTVENDLENRMIRGAVVKGPLWIRNVYDGATSQKWARTTYFGRYSTCAARSDEWRMFAGWEQSRVCAYKTSSAIEKSGYWGTEYDWPGYLREFVCVKNADNDFTGRKPCIANHKLDEETGLCEWTGPKDACLQMIDYTNKSMFVLLPNFPQATYIHHNYIYGPWSDTVTKVIVRRGCMFTGYTHGIDVMNEMITAGNNNSAYGEHVVLSYYAGDFPNSADGMTRVSCFCDPTEATLNDHEPAPPPKKKCVEHHVFNETTQSCEWKHDPKFCGELITNDGRRQMLEIPDFPANRKYDVNHWTTKYAENFHVTVVEMIVRQHCWATLLASGLNSKQYLPTAGYGKHTVISHYNGQTSNWDDGMGRVICECIR